MSSKLLSQYDNIPDALKSLPRWLNFSVEDGKKIPYVSGSNAKASSTQSSTWGTFEAAVADVANGKRDHIGFAFAEKDGLVFIDLDDADDRDQQRIIKRFKTYQQRSISGEGVHIIGKGTFEGAGKHPAFPAVGLFKSARLCLMTGDGSGELSSLETADLQAVHSWLSKGTKDAPGVDLTNHDATIPDQTIFELGCQRFNKFRSLSKGDWQKYEEYVGDHSQADHAFLGMLCDLSESNAQVRELFGMSGMWSEARAKKKAGHGFENYVNRTIKKIRSSQAREAQLIKDIPLNWTEIVNAKEVSDQGSRKMIDSMPQGLIKKMADWVWRRAEYSMQEAATAAAMGVMSTVAGRNYQTFTGSGLNNWIILLAGTGAGKNDYQNGVSSIVKCVSDANIHGKGFLHMFSGELASGQAVEDVMATRNRCMSYFPEFDDAYYNLTSPNAAPHFRSLKKAILNAYMQSGKDAYLPRRMKARQKGDAAPDETPIKAPNLVLGGECTPEAFYEKLSMVEVSKGFLQRFTILHAKDESISRRPSPEARLAMPEDLVQELLELFQHCDNLEADGTFITVPLTKEARELISEYRNEKKDATFELGVDEATKQYYTRAGLKVIRIASLFAVSDNWRKPVVTKVHVKWAIHFIDHTDEEILGRFKTGEVGTGQVKQEHEVLEIAKSFTRLSPTERRRKGMSSKVANHATLLPMALLKKLVVTRPSFSSDKLGAVTAFDRCINSMINAGVFTKVEKNHASEEYGHLQGVLLVVH